VRVIAAIRGRPGRRLGPRRPPLICFTGIDGAGKTTQIELLAERLCAADWETTTVWGGGRRPLTRTLLQIAKWCLGAPTSHERSPNGVDGADARRFDAYVQASHRLSRRSRLLRQLWIHLTLIEHAIEADLIVLPRLLRGTAVVCDRYLFRSVVSLAVMLDLSEVELRRLTRHPAHALAVRPALTVLLDLPASVAYGRRHDLQSVEFLERRASVYRALAEMGDVRLFDATLPADILANEIWSTVQVTLGLTERCRVPPRGTPSAELPRQLVTALRDDRGSQPPPP
jgi:thymidylate kinase